MTIDDFVDDVSDIRNHISPTTVVIDLDGEEELEQGNGYENYQNPM